MIVKVLGSGCMNCQKLKALAEKAVQQLGIDAQIVEVKDIQEIMAHGVMATPALVVDEQLRLAGRVPSLDEVVRILQKAQ